MEVKNKRILKNGTLAGYVKQKDGSWKWTFLKKEKQTGKGIFTGFMRTGTRSCRWLHKEKNSRTDTQFWKDYRRIMCGYGNEEKKRGRKQIREGLQELGRLYGDENLFTRTYKIVKKGKGHPKVLVRSSKNDVSSTFENEIMENRIEGHGQINKTSKTSKTTANANMQFPQFKLPSQYVLFDNVREYLEHLLKNNRKIYMEIIDFMANVNLPNKKQILENPKYYEILIGTQDEINEYSVNYVRFNFQLKQANKEIINENYSFFMRHSIRLEQFYSEMSNINILKYEKLPEIYSIFYPTENAFNTESVLSRFGLFLAYIEGYRMKESGVIFDGIVSSPYIRCIQTAFMVALAMNIHTIYVQSELGEKINQYHNILNFYKKCPNIGDEINYEGIKIISDGKTGGLIYKNYFNYYRSLNQGNILYVGHGNMNFDLPDKLANTSAYASVLGMKNQSGTPIYASRSLYNQKLLKLQLKLQELENIQNKSKKILNNINNTKLEIRLQNL
jgi:hypothetical protein